MRARSDPDTPALCVEQIILPEERCFHVRMLVSSYFEEMDMPLKAKLEAVHRLESSAGQG